MNLLLKFPAMLLAIIAMLNVAVAWGGMGHGSGMGYGHHHDEYESWSSDEESPSGNDWSSHGVAGMHDWSSDGDGGMHHHYCRDPDDFFNRDTYWTNLTTCDPEFACQYGGDRGHNHRSVAKTFVCRTTFHPITGEPFERVRCIPTDRAWETDVCGCCGGECPDLTNNTASCLDQVSVDEEDNVVQFALGTSDLTSSSSQLSSDGSSPIANTLRQFYVALGLGATMLVFA
ncbi:hypothetical protein IV203_001378 [Nitzschia inconspicua]|uniref:Uncharacterized protein n=1 Tax=Nitzschia inconspicua TaxID=303405 RepID=A0A9K3L6Z9_9STRA|nr:hypothetical protein IV203_001378 [Nitzschia inconspicua]